MASCLQLPYVKKVLLRNNNGKHENRTSYKGGIEVKLAMQLPAGSTADQHPIGSLSYRISTIPVSAALF